MTTREQPPESSPDTSSSTSTAERGSPAEQPSGAHSATELIRTARELFEAMTGRQVEAVSAFTKTGDGWQINIEVIELSRIPDTTSVLATYAVRLEPGGDFAGYERLRRYARGQIDV